MLFKPGFRYGKKCFVCVWKNLIQIEKNYFNTQYKVYFHKHSYNHLTFFCKLNTHQSGSGSKIKKNVRDV